MNIKHNTQGGHGLQFPEMAVGETYISLNHNGRTPRIYIACRNAGRPVGREPDFLVNLATGTCVTPGPDVRFRHLPDATLVTGE